MGRCLSTWAEPREAFVGASQGCQTFTYHPHESARSMHRAVWWACAASGFAGFTDPGEEMTEVVERILVDIANIERLGEPFSTASKGSLSSPLHTRRRVTCCCTWQRSARPTPKGHLTLRQGSPAEIAGMLSNGDAVIGICTEILRDVPALTAFPFYSWRHGVVVAKGQRAREGSRAAHAGGDRRVAHHHLP